MLPDDLDNALKMAIAAGGSEPDIVRKFISLIAHISPPPNIKIRMAFIHQRPYVFFVSPPIICGKQKCEFGDLLYVFKRVDNEMNLIDSRASFLQAKKGIGSWHIDAHQIEFLSNIKKIQFRFGNSVYKRGGYTPIVFNGLPHSGVLSQYLLLDPSDALCYETYRVKSCQRLYQHSFSLNPLNPILCKKKVPFCSNCDSHLKFIRGFCLGINGSRISGRLMIIVELIYKYLNWTFDPPEEFSDNFIEDAGGFGVIEITETVDRTEFQSG